MSNSEAPFSFTTKVDGDLFTIRGNDFYDFLGNLKAVDSVPSVLNLIALINSTVVDTMEQAIVNVQQAIPQAVAIPETVQAPPAQPAFAPVPPPQPAVAAPQAAPAGSMNCAHGPMKLMPAGVSKKSGKPYNAFYACQWPNRDEQCKTVQA